MNARQAVVVADHRDGDFVEVRLVVPRGVFEQQPPAPELVSQANSMEVLGLPKRRFLELVRSPGYPGRVLKLGRLRLVRRTELLAHLEATPAQRSSPGANGAAALASRAVHGLARRLGLEEVTRASGR